MWTTLAKAVRNQCRLINDSSGNREQDTTLEIPHPQQHLHVDNAGKRRQEPVQTDQRQLWKQGARHYIRDPTSVTTPSCGQRWQRPSGTSADWSTTALEKQQQARHYMRKHCRNILSHVKLEIPTNTTKICRQSDLILLLNSVEIAEWQIELCAIDAV